MKTGLIGLALVALVASACNSKPADAEPPAAAAASAEAKTYVCPMHPEVTDTKPSKCPKCGMTLELEKK
ncbi:MAG: hypothetical protein KC776_15990 [Myxococcales bacterium]|nr:hypothetical protein [Myxococcales bacterium]